MPKPRSPKTNVESHLHPAESKLSSALKLISLIKPAPLGTPEPQKPPYAFPECSLPDRTPPQFVINYTRCVLFSFPEDSLFQPRDDLQLACAKVRITPFLGLFL